MDLDSVFTGMSISSSGLHAERTRLETIAKNIANANVVQTPGEEPFRRKQVVFETILDDFMNPGEAQGGVRVGSIRPDMETPLEVVHDPSHPMADPKTGMVTHSNVEMSYEMVDLMSASRSYEANLKAMKVFKDMATQSLRILE